MDSILSLCVILKLELFKPVVILTKIQLLYLPVLSDTIQTLLKLFLQQLRHLPLHLGPEFLDAPDSVQPTQLIEVHAWLHELGHASVQHRPGDNNGQN